MSFTNVLLSDAQLALATNQEIILTKEIIMLKAIGLFQAQVPILQNTYFNNLQPYALIAASVPKISKGENYNQLPYIMLDYPAYYTKQNIFALRTMFWWGNFVSITLLLKGEYKTIFEQKIIHNLHYNAAANLYICINESEWMHHFEPYNYILCSKINKLQIDEIKQKSFIKIALKYKLQHWNMLQQLLPEGYSQIKQLLFN